MFTQLQSIIIRVLTLTFITVAAVGQASAATDLLTETKVQGGLVVVLGCEEAESLAAFRAGDTYIVQGLDTRSARIAAAKELIAEEGLCGPVTARVFDGENLPYAEEMVNLLVVNEPFQVARRELERVLVPRGVLMRRTRDGWQKTVKAWPEDIDEWSHWNHDAGNTAVSKDTRVGPPRRIKWFAPPLMTRHHFAISFTALVTADGRLLSVHDEKAKQTERFVPQRYSLVARDAFNGLPLWKLPLPDLFWPAKLTSPSYGHSVATNYHNKLPKTLVTDGQYVYLFLERPWVLAVLDAATGKVVKKFEDITGVGELVCDDGVLYVGIRPPEPGDATEKRRKMPLGEARLTAIRTGSWEQLWDVPAPGFEYETLTAANGRVFYEANRNFVALNAADGSELWRTSFTEPNRKTYWRMWNPVAVADLLIASRSYMGGRRGATIAFEAATGKQLWRSEEVRQSREGVFPIGDKLYCGTSAVNMRDGTPAEGPSAEGLFSKGHHFRCYPWRATTRYLIPCNRGAEFIPLHPGDEGAKNDYVRGNCGIGVFPANGLLYKTPHGCFCYNGVMLNGFLALAADADTTTPDLAPDDPKRLEKGPAYGEDTDQHGQTRTDTNGSAWPMYRQNARRLGSSTAKVGDTVAVKWQVAPGGELTPPVCAAGLLLTADKTSHRVLAYDPATGEPRWQFHADARIDSPPTIHQGRVFFGCADGFVYCLDAKNGTLAWRFRAAARERWISHDGQIESAWPVHGSVLFEDGKVYATAGRHTWFDGGIHVYALDPATGKVLHYRLLKDEALAEGVVYEGERPYNEASHSEGARSYILVAGDNHLFLGPIVLTKELDIVNAPYIPADPQDAKFIRLTGAPYVDQESFVRINEEQSFKAASKIKKGNPALGSKRTELQLSSTGGFLDGAIPFERHYWMYAKLWPGNNHANLGAKCGTLLCVDDDITYGVKIFNFRDRYGSGDPRTSSKGQLIFADDIDNEPVIPDRARGCRAGVGYYRAAPPKWFHWKQMNLNAMTAAGDHLFVAGSDISGSRRYSLDPYEGRAGCVLMTFDKKSGEELSKLGLDDQPVFDGLIAAEGSLYMSTMNGKIICLTGKAITAR